MECPTKIQKKRKRVEATVTDRAMQYFEKIITNEEASDEEISQKKKNKKTHKCKLCLFDFNGINRWNLSSHLSTKHPSVFSEITSNKKEPISVTRLRLLQRCTEIVTINGRPFNSLLDSGFQALIETTLDDLAAGKCGVNLSHNNLAEVKQHLSQTAKKVRDKICAEAANKPLSLLADIVTKHQRSIMGVSIQYHFNGDLKVRSIGFIELADKHTGKYLAQLIIERLQDYGINLKQIITITTDNGKNMLKMVRDIANQLVNEIDEAKTNTDTPSKNVPFSNNYLNEDVHTDIEIGVVLAKAREISDDEALEAIFEEVAASDSNDTLLNVMTKEMEVSGADWLWNITGLNCAAHTVQLAIKDCLNELGTSEKNVIELCREICKMLRTDSICNEMANLGKEYRLPRLESKTRWGAMYLMVCHVFIIIYCMNCISI